MNAVMHRKIIENGPRNHSKYKITKKNEQSWFYRDDSIILDTPVKRGQSVEPGTNSTARRNPEGESKNTFAAVAN